MIRGFSSAFAYETVSLYFFITIVLKFDWLRTLVVIASQPEILWTRQLQKKM